MTEARIGTSGWHYAHWGRGVFYPAELKRADWLGYFARSFNTVEINNTFYQLPREETFQKWREATLEGFRFALKASRFITHIKRLKEPEKTISNFLSRAGLLRNRLGPVLFQLPPTLKCDLDRLARTLDYLSSQDMVPELEAVFEFRHPSWLCDRTFEILEGHGASLCLSDMETCPVTAPLRFGFVYARRHGPSGAYAGCYSERHTRKDAERVEDWLREGRAGYMYFNNDVEGFAVKNALRLKELLAN